MQCSTSNTRNSLAHSLGKFFPSKFQSEVIEAEIRPLLPLCCRKKAVSVRIPEGVEPHPDNMEWHQDASGPLGGVRHMVLWASESPTQILADGQMELFEPYDLIWLDNYAAMHRQPCDTRPNERWFARVACNGEP